MDTREQQQVQEVCAAAIRALAGKPGLQLRGRRLFDGTVATPPAPAHLVPSPDRDDMRSFRGAADGLALRAGITDPAVHAAHAPEEPTARRLFDLLEQYRVESLVGDEYVGVRHNLQHRHDAWLDAFLHEGLHDTEQGILVYAVALTCRSRVTGIPVDDDKMDTIEPVRFMLAPHIGGETARLRSTRTDQAAYAAVARVIAMRVAALLLKMAPEDKAGGQENADARKRGIALWLAGESDVEQEFPVAGLGQSRLLEDGTDGYRIFTRAYDREIDASALARAAVLAGLREKLDAEVARAGVNVGRLARHLQAFFAIPVDDGWNSAQEEGRIDGRLLSQLVASPTERRLFKQDRREPLADCAVTFLIDCSGSMKQHGVRLAVLIDVFTRALELAGALTEVLGFTTGAWNGGLARRDWLRAGSPAHPGRLNEAMHVVFKPAQVPWRRRRRDIAALLRNEFYREGIDGEAVEWACGRLRAVESRRKLLVVVSDGSPMDGATALANDPHYLDHHLQHVVAQQAAAGDIEIAGLGVGLDLSPYYSRSRVLDLSQGVGLRTFLEASGLMAGRRP